MYEELFLNGVITGITVFISSYTMLKITQKRLKTEALEWIKSEQCAKIVYQMGAIAAQGAKSGFGINKQPGKFSLEGLIGQIAGRFIEQKFMPTQTQPEPGSMNVS